MYAWERIQDSLAYIESHLQEQLLMEELAEQAQLSVYYFQRVFQRFVHRPVKEYIRLRRLAKAAEMLKQREHTMLEIALLYGFESHSSFSRSFKQIYGITPHAYRMGNVTLDHVLIPDLKLRHHTLEEGEVYVCSDMTLEINQRIEQEPQPYYGESMEAEIAGLAQAKVNTLKPLWDHVDADVAYVDILTPHNEELFNYFVGSTIRDVNKEVRWMPAGKYIVCRYEAESFDKLVNEALYKASDYLYGTWLLKRGIVPREILMQKYIRTDETYYMELWASVNE